MSDYKVYWKGQHTNSRWKLWGEVAEKQLPETVKTLFNQYLDVKEIRLKKIEN